MYLLAIWISSSEKMFIQFLCPFLIGLFLFFATELYGFLVYFGYKPLTEYVVCKYFLPFQRLPFLLLIVFFFLFRSSFIWCSPTCLNLPLLSYPYPLPRPTLRSFFSYVFFYKAYGFRSYIWVFNPFWVNFGEWCKICLLYTSDAADDWLVV